MRKVVILFTLIIGLYAVTSASAQTKIVFAKGASSKTLTVTLPAKGERSYSLSVKKGQVINVSLSGDVAVSKSNDFPVVSVNLTNGDDTADNWQDGERYLSILAGRKGTYIISVSNSSKRARTFKMKVTVTNSQDDYLGGIRTQ